VREELQVAVARHKILLRQFREDFDDLRAAEAALVEEPLQQQLKELLLRLVVDESLLLGHLPALELLRREHTLDDVGQDLDEALAEQVRLAVEEAEQTADVLVDGLRRLLRQLCEEFRDILDSDRLGAAVVVEDLFRQGTDDLVRELVLALGGGHQADELGQRLGQVVLRVEQINDLLRVLPHDVLELVFVSLQALFEQTEDRLLDV
jgi:hypothetical protein